MKKNKIVMSLVCILSVLLITLGSSLSLFSYNKQSKVYNSITTGKYENICNYEVGYSFKFEIDSEFKVPCNGLYKIELWGMQTENAFGNYTSNDIDLLKDNNLYIKVNSDFIGVINSNNENIISNNYDFIESTCVSEEPISNCLKQGNGFIKITLESIKEI